MSEPAPSVTASEFDALLQGRLHDPFRYLGLQREAAGWVLRVFHPHADAVWLRLPSGLSPLESVHPAGLFEWRGAAAPPAPYVLGVSEGGRVRDVHDPYAFVPALSGHDLYLFNEGRLRQAWRTLGVHLEQRNGVNGVRFGVWAPNAERVSVVGDFNRWDGRVHPMGVHGSSGVWELFIPDCPAASCTSTRSATATPVKSWSRRILMGASSSAGPAPLRGCRAKRDINGAIRPG